jgi:hypothetical protein
MVANRANAKAPNIAKLFKDTFLSLLLPVSLFN